MARSRWAHCIGVLAVVLWMGFPAAQYAFGEESSSLDTGHNTVSSPNKPPREDVDSANPPPSSSKARFSTGIPVHTMRELALSYAVLVFGLVIVLVEHVMLRKRPEAVTPENLLLLNAVTIIVIGTLFLVTSGFKDQQIAPAMGLFGTIIGYLLGRRSRTGMDEKGDKENTKTGIGGGQT
jgi:hypothetical protein